MPYLAGGVEKEIIQTPKKMSDQINQRRRFLKQAGFLSAAVGMGIFLPACRKEDLDPLEYPSVSLKIRELGIRVEDMNASRVFWTETLGFPLLSLTANEFVVQIGSSRLSFRPKNFCKVNTNQWNLL
jgi:hypothetical protein